MIQIENRSLRHQEQHLPSAGHSLRKTIAQLSLVVVSVSVTHAQVNHRPERRHLGWSSWSQESHIFTNNSEATAGGETWLTEDQIKTQSEAVLRIGLQRHGCGYVNMAQDGRLAKLTGPIQRVTTIVMDGRCQTQRNFRMG
jgi:hypothetical protein